MDDISFDFEWAARPAVKEFEWSFQREYDWV